MHFACKVKKPTGKQQKPIVKANGLNKTFLRKKINKSNKCILSHHSKYFRFQLENRLKMCRNVQIQNASLRALKDL